MIDAKELMIGNYVRVGDLKGYFVPFAIYADSIDFCEGGKVFNCHRTNLKPIPITPKWLKDFGFTCDLDNLWGYKDFDGFPFLVEDCEDIFSVSIGDVKGVAKPKVYWLTDCHYVHELQNLFYTLTKQELAIDSAGGEA